MAREFVVARMTTGVGGMTALVVLQDGEYRFAETVTCALNHEHSKECVMAEIDKGKIGVILTERLDAALEKTERTDITPVDKVLDKSAITTTLSLEPSPK
jgi:hypothetical protein